jgi:polysaccharide pyruvyl transferase WcaK-like protein
VGVTKNNSPTVVVWGHYHGGNLGDELVVATIVDAVRARLPHARIVAVSMDPDDTRERHGIEAYPINPRIRRPSRAARLPGLDRLRRLTRQVRRIVLEVPFAWRSYRLLRRVDLVIVAGSGQLLDEWRGPWLHPYTTYRWALLARLARVSMYFPSIGAGPIETQLGAFFLRRAVASAEYVSVRDAHSARVLASIGVTRPLPVCPDMGYGLSDEELEVAADEAARRSGEKVVGLNVMAHQDPRYWPRGESRRYDAFIAKMAAFGRWLLDNGYTVRLFSSQTRSDARVAEDFGRLLRASGEDDSRLDSAIGDIEQVEDLVRVVGGCDVVVAARYHSVLLPLLLDVPVLGLAYNAKTSELLTDAGAAECCFDIDGFQVQQLTEAFQRLDEREASPDRGAHRELVAGHRRAVAEQFDAILGAVRPDGSGAAES